MSTRLSIRTLLRHYVPRYGEPPREHVADAVERVWEALEPGVNTAPTSALRRKPQNLDVATVASAFRRKARWVPLAAAAVLALAAAVGTAIVWGPADNALYAVAEGEVHDERGTIRSNGGGTGAVLVLKDGSRVEMRSQSELALERADDGVRIHLNRGGIIVNATKQRTGHLYVQTKDVTVSVVGTVFLVNADEGGSRVAVIEGEVRVQQGTTAQKLLSGEQVATNPAMTSAPVIEEIAWSRNADQHRALLLQSAVTAPPVRPADVSAQAREAFETVSVRLAPPMFGGARDGSPPGTPAPARPTIGAPCIGLDLQVDARRFATRSMPLHGLITHAYGRTCQTTDQIVGGPAWARVDGYDVEATLPTGSPGYTVQHLRNGAAPRLQLMLQTMLADRFKLVLRREMREMSAYNLIVVTPGKIAPSADQQNAPDRAASTIAGPPVGIIGPSIRMQWTTMSRFASTLQMHAGRPVIDRTELTGLFDILLQFTNPGGLFGADLEAAQREQLPSLLQEQLGLKLEPARAPVEFLVIERVERPTEN